MLNQFKRCAAILAAIVLIICSTACTPAQETQVINDIEGIVTLAGSLLSIVQTFGALSTPQEVQDITAAEQIAQDYSAAASQAITEYDSSDSWNVKVDKITALFTSINVGVQIPTAKINAAVQLLTAAVKLLLGQLGVVTTATPVTVHGSLKTLNGEAKAIPVWFGGLIPGTMQHKLKGIQKKADANVALAGRLKAATRLVHVLPDIESVRVGK